MFIAIKDQYKFLYNQAITILRVTDRFLKKHETVLFWFLGILYKFVLDLLYVKVASPLYNYAGLEYDPSFLKYIISAILYLVLFACIPKKEHSCASVLLHIQFAYIIAPMLSFYALSGASSKYMLMVFVCAILEALIIRRNSGRTKPVYLKGMKNYATVLIGIMAVVALTVPILYNGFAGLKAFDFDYIYEMRKNATYPPGFTYLFFWMGKAIIPFSVILLIEKKKYWWALIAAAIQILLYMECGNKYLLFILVPVLAVYVLAKSKHLIKLVYLGLSALFLVLLVAHRLDTDGGHALGTQTSFYIAVRAIFHPADNKFVLYECFSQLPKLFFSDGLIGKMLGFTNLYSGAYGQIIHAYNGGIYLDANMNTGYLAESYAQMGFPGMLLMSGLFSFILCCIESYNNKKTFCLITAVFAMYIIDLCDISLLTTLLSSGMIIVILMMAVYFNKERDHFIHGV